MSSANRARTTNILERLAAALARIRPELMETKARRRAAVALLLRERGLGLEILVIRRAENERDP